METFYIVKIAVLTTISFAIAIIWTPLLTHFLYKYRLGKQIRDSESAPIMSGLHAHKSGTPTMGGLLIWVTAVVIALVFAVLNYYFDGFWGNLNFLTRSQTLLPLGVLVATAIVGLVDDYLNIRKIGPFGGGLRFRTKIWIYLAIAVVGAWWFYFKLDWDIIRVPFVGNFNVGWWIIPIFIATIVGTAFSVNQTDGLDGLAGGTLMTAFGAFGVIAFTQGKFELAAFCGVIIGALLAFLWFNINPARFFMGDTGSMALGITLGVIAMLTNALLLLPIIGLIFVVEALSTIIQILSKKIRKKKIFLSAPIHHHFEASGWSEPKIVMRFWVISWVMGAVGVVLALMDFWLIK